MFIENKVGSRFLIQLPNFSTKSPSESPQCSELSSTIAAQGTWSVPVSYSHPSAAGIEIISFVNRGALSAAIPCGSQASVTLWSVCARQAARCVSRPPLTLVLNGPSRLNVQMPQFKCKCAILSRVHSSNKIGLCSLPSWLWSDRE